jgi:pantoate--beta-alanine ligase
MQRFRAPAEMKAYCLSVRNEGSKIGFVPTMGALHEGHLSLVRASKAACDKTVVSIFVNPLQFGPDEDLESYPRRTERDCSLLEAAGAHAVFLPTSADIYGTNQQTRVVVHEITRDLCGANRAGHFEGVTTVVLKLLNIVQPQAAFFGEKDYQQLRTIERMVHDLFLPVRITGCPIIREPDGLALSSRNQYLSASDRQRALAISRSLYDAQEQVRAGERNVSKILGRSIPILQGQVDSIDYLEIRDAKTLDAIREITTPAVILAAAFVSNTRLIDNMPLNP